MDKIQHRYFGIYKPVNMVSQFISPDKVGLLGDIDFEFPEGIHAIGRLDNLSEGLLLLTTNKRVTKLLFQGSKPHKRTYLVQVTHVVSAANLEVLRTGVSIRVKGGEYYTTGICDVHIVNKPETLCNEGFLFREDIPHTWLTITLTEGKFHQVRKMVSAVGHRCRRLIRLSIEDMTIDNLQPGEVHEFDETDFFKLLQIDDWQ